MKYLIILSILFLTSCSYDYKVKDLKSDTKTVMHSSSALYEPGDTILIGYNVYGDAVPCSNCIDKVVIISKAK